MNLNRFKTFLHFWKFKPKIVMQESVLIENKDNTDVSYLDLFGNGKTMFINCAPVCEMFYESTIQDLIIIIDNSSKASSLYKIIKSKIRRCIIVSMKVKPIGLIEKSLIEDTIVISLNDTSEDSIVGSIVDSEVKNSIFASFHLNNYWFWYLKQSKFVNTIFWTLQNAFSTKLCYMVEDCTFERCSMNLLPSFVVPGDCEFSECSIL